MELIILAGMGLVGYYLNNNERKNSKNINQHKYESESESSSNGTDIYNQNGLENIKKGKKKLTKDSIKKKDISPNYDFENFYNIDDLDEIYSEKKKYNNNFKKIKQKTKNSVEPRTFNKKSKKKKNGIQYPDNKNLLDISEKITNNTCSINRILQEKNNECDKSDFIDPKYFSPIDNLNDLNDLNDFSNNNDLCNSQPQPTYLSQFDAQTFDSEGLPSAKNDIYQSNDKIKLSDLERKLSYQGGWSQYNQQGTMTYDIVSDNELVHDNMVPFFSMKYGYGSNDLKNNATIDYKNELFTGNLKSTWNEKKEIKPHFVPTADISYMYGTPVRTEEEINRYIPGRYRQNEQLFNKTMVTPGLKLDYNEIGTHGYHSMYRTMDKTIDELRVKPKITYEGRIIEGKKGQERPIQAPVITYKPTTYKTTTEADLLPTDGIVDGPKTRDNFIMKETDRAGQHIEYTGGAYTSQESIGKNVPEHMREKYKYSTKPVFKLPKPLQKFSKIETKFNANIESYNLPITTKDLTINNNHIGSAGSVPGSSTYTNNCDIAKTTLKEINTQPQIITNLASNTMRGTVQPLNIANPTIKETTIENKLNPHAASLSSMQRVYFSDSAKTTTKETICDPVVPINAVQNTNIYASWMDNAKETTKETTVQIPHQTILLPVGQQQRAPNPQDNAKNTIKETTIQIPYQTIITPINQQQRIPNPQDVTRTTIKETTTQIPYQTMIVPIDQYQRAPNLQDITKTTTKETTVQIPYQTILTAINQQQRTPNLQDITKTTTKETTVNTPYQSFIFPTNQQQRAPNFQDIAKTTTKETTIQIPNQTIITPNNQQQKTNLQDIAKTTIKETTVNIPHQLMITPVDQYQRAPHPQDIPRTTIKETTANIPYQTIITPTNQQQRAPNLQDIMKTTTKETTVQTPWNNFIVPLNQQQRAPNPQDVTKPTMKETTIQIPWNTHITPINQQQRAANLQDITKTTTKETTVQIPYQSIITPINQQQRTVDPQDSTRTTTKEMTVQIPYQTIITPVNQQQRTSNPQDIGRTTMKETTAQIPHQTIITGINQIQGTSYPQDNMRPTIKETTVGIPYQTVTTAVNQYQGITNPQDISKTTTKETTICVPYNTHTTGTDQYRGKAHVFDRTPLRTTIKEQTSEIPYKTHITAVNQYQITPKPQDIAKTTTKETIVQIPHNTHLSIVNQQQRAPNPQDITKTTVKETTIQIPYNTNIAAINQTNGPATTFNRTPIETTTKETTINNDHLGLTGNTYGNGYGYMAENIYVPNTNKQFTCQEVYIAPLEGEIKNKLYNDAYNAQIDNRKELLHQYRSPTNSGVNVGPNIDNIVVQLKNDDNKMPGPIIGYSTNNNLDRLKQRSSAKPVDNISSDRFIDPILLKQLETNPYNISLFH